MKERFVVVDGATTDVYTDEFLLGYALETLAGIVKEHESYMPMGWIRTARDVIAKAEKSGHVVERPND